MKTQDHLELSDIRTPALGARSAGIGALGSARGPKWLASRRLAVTLPAVLACCAALGAASTNVPVGPPSPPQSLAESFRQFLSHRPPIKDIVFRISNAYASPDLEVGIGPPGRTHTEKFDFPGSSTYEAAVQPKGYYLKFLDNPATYFVITNGHYVYKPPKPGEEEVYGADERVVWSLGKGYDRVAGFTSRPPYPGASPKNTQPVVQGWLLRDTLDRVLYLGLDHLIGSKIVWDTPLQFSASQQGQPEAFGDVVSTNSSGLPLRLEYRLRKAPSTIYVVAYSFPAKGTPYLPRRITLGRRAGAKTLWRYTNFIDEIDLGLDATAAQGYHLSDFLSADQVLANLVTESNGVEYKVTRAGNLAVVKFEKDPYRVYRQATAKPGPGYGGIAAMVAVSAGLLILGAWALRRRANSRSSH